MEIEELEVDKNWKHSITIIRTKNNTHGHETPYNNHNKPIKTHVHGRIASWQAVTLHKHHNDIKWRCETWPHNKDVIVLSVDLCAYLHTWWFIINNTCSIGPTTTWCTSNFVERPWHSGPHKDCFPDIVGTLNRITCEVWPNMCSSWCDKCLEAHSHWIRTHVKWHRKTWVMGVVACPLCLFIHMSYASKAILLPRGLECLGRGFSWREVPELCCWREKAHLSWPCSEEGEASPSLFVTL